MGCVSSGHSTGLSDSHSHSHHPPDLIKAKQSADAMVAHNAQSGGDSPVAAQRSVVGVTSKTAIPHEKDLLDDNPPANVLSLHHSSSASASSSSASAPFGVKLYYFDHQEIYSFTLPSVFSSDRLTDLKSRILNHYSLINFHDQQRKTYPNTRTPLFVLNQRAMDENKTLAEYQFDSRTAAQQKIFIIFVQRK